MHILNSMSKLIVTAFFVISFALLGFLGGRLTSYKKITNSPVQLEQTKVTTSFEAATNPLFKSQSATFQGKITKISGRTLTVESDTGQKGEFEISEKVAIYKFAPNSSVASASADIKTIETGKQVLISLNLITGK